MSLTFFSSGQFWIILTLSSDSKSKRRKGVFKILYWLRIKLVLPCFNIGTSFVEFFEHFFNILAIHKYNVRVDD